MKNLIFLLIGIISMIAISATTVSVMTVKPAQPKGSLVKYFRFVDDTPNYILKGYERGYKLQGIYNNAYTNGVVVIMERY